MLEELLTRLSAALTQSLLVALLGAFLWGVISILLSPCHLASIPLLIGFLASEAKSGNQAGSFSCRCCFLLASWRP